MRLSVADGLVMFVDLPPNIIQMAVDSIRFGCAPFGAAAACGFP